MLTRFYFILILLFSCHFLLSQEICNNGIDDDFDSLIDLNDTADCDCGIVKVIPNQSFEDSVCCPDTITQLGCAQGWAQATNATSDYFNCGFNFLGYENAGLGLPPDGTGYAGFISFDGYKEYLGACLTSPLVTGEPYALEMNIASFPIHNGGVVCGGGVINYPASDIILWGHPNAVCGTFKLPTFECPQSFDGQWQVIGSVNYSPVGTWGTITINVTPTFDVHTVMIGAPCTLPPGFASPACFPYFAVDNLVLQESVFFDTVALSGDWCTNNVVLSTVSNAGSSYQWYLDGVALVGETSTTLNVSTGGFGPGTYTIITTSLATGSCASDEITIPPPPTTVNIPSDATLCIGATVPATNFTSVPAGATFTWTNSNTAIGLAASGSGNVPSFTATNTGSSPISGTITVTPRRCGYDGTPSSYTITVNPNSTVSVPADADYCNGASVSASSFSSTPAGATFAWTNSNTSIGLAASGSGNVPAFTATNIGSSSISGTITVTPTLNSCPGTPSTYTITVHPTPTVSLPANTSYCPNTAVPASAFSSTPAGGTFTWTNSNTAIGLAASGSGNVPTFITTNAGTTAISGTISVIPTVNGCPGNSSDYIITVDPEDDPSFSYPSTTYCITGTDPIATILGVPGGDFTISGAGVINGSDGTIDLDATGLGPFAIVYSTIPAGNPCPSNTAFNITITDAPSGGFSYDSPNYCQNATAPNLTFDPGASGGTFSATPAGLSIDSTSGAIDLANSNPGLYKVFNFIDTMGGCAATLDSTSIEIFMVDSALFSYSASTYCLTGTDPVAILGANATTGGNFSISSTGVINGSNGTIDLDASGLGPFTITYNTTPVGNPCPSSATFNITITAAPSGGFSYDSPSYCQNATAPSLTFDPGASGGTFSATPAGLSIDSTSGAIDLANSNPGLYKVFNFIDTMGGCAAALDSASIEIFMVDSALFSYSTDSFCISGTDPLAVLDTNATTGGNFSISGAGVINGSNGTIDLDASGLGSFTVTYNTTPVGNPCPSSDVFNITITDAPGATFSYNSPFCEGDPVNVFPAFTGNNLPGIFSANPNSIAFVDTTTGEIDLTNSSPGNYTIFNNLPAANGCAADIDSTSILIHPMFSTPVADSICDGDSILLGGAFQSTAGTYYDTLNSINGCDSIIETALSIVPPNSINPDPVSTICDVDDITLSATNSGNGTITWYDDPNGNNIIGTGSPISITNTGTGIFTYYVQTVSFCSSSIQSVNVAIGGVDAIINADPITGEIPLEVNFDATSSSGIVSSFEWDFDGDDVNDNSDSITANIYPDTGKFNVRLIVSDGVCYDTAFILIDAFFLESALIIPNVFTPNGDGHNDIFTVDGVNLKSVEGVIYNRWGQKMFSWNNVKGHWNGRTLAGSEAPDGTYFYIISAEGVDGETYFRKGGFSLIR